MTMPDLKPREATAHKVGATPADDPVQAFVSWVSATALPLWAERPDQGRLPFVEARGSDGRPLFPGTVRLRVASRQLVVYSQAASAGLRWCRPVAEQAWHAMRCFYWRPRGGWYARVAHDGTAVDKTVTLYDQSFAIFACACWARLSGSRSPIAYALKTLAYVDRKLRHGSQPGWRSRSDGAARDQNGHMHFLEALLALALVSRDACVTVRIEEILALLGARLCDPACGAIVEEFDDDWTAVSPIRVEPGHLYEWATLIAQAARLGFASPVDPSCLLAFADRHGWAAGSGLILDSVDPAGRPVDIGHRLWPHCEALKARSGHPAGLAGARRIAAAMWGSFLADAGRGVWRERIAAPADAPVPATSLYHLWGAAQSIADAGWARLEAAPC